MILHNKIYFCEIGLKKNVVIEIKNVKRQWKLSAVRICCVLRSSGSPVVHGQRMYYRVRTVNDYRTGN